MEKCSYLLMVLYFVAHNSADLQIILVVLNEFTQEIGLEKANVHITPKIDLGPELSLQKHF